MKRLREVALDLAEGADMVMVKPGLPYLDIVQRVSSDLRRADAGLSGLRRICDDHGRRSEWLDRWDRVMMETLLAFKRAGAAGVITYFAEAAAQRL